MNLIKETALPTVQSISNQILPVNTSISTNQILNSESDGIDDSPLLGTFSSHTSSGSSQNTSRLLRTDDPGDILAWDIGINIPSSDVVNIPSPLNITQYLFDETFSFVYNQNSFYKNESSDERTSLLKQCDAFIQS